MGRRNSWSAGDAELAVRKHKARTVVGIKAVTSEVCSRYEQREERPPSLIRTCQGPGSDVATMGDVERRELLKSRGNVDSRGVVGDINWR
jgi:hypothetical protein